MSIRSPHQGSAAVGRYGRVAVIGAGAWGTALAAVAAASGSEVLLWAREPDVVQTVSAERENKRFLPGAKLPGAIEPTLDIVRASATPMTSWLT
jgi:glycerol-3-phosphate dehydrogenase (NAD(P)+)